MLSDDEFVGRDGEGKVDLPCTCIVAATKSIKRSGLWKGELTYVGDLQTISETLPEVDHYVDDVRKEVDDGSSKFWASESCPDPLTKNSNDEIDETNDGPEHVKDLCNHECSKLGGTQTWIDGVDVVVVVVAFLPVHSTVQ